MNHICNAPDSNRVVIIVWEDKENKKIICATYRYKKNKWVGCASGEVHELPRDAFWIESPIQPTF